LPREGPVVRIPVDDDVRRALQVEAKECLADPGLGVVERLLFVLLVVDELNVEPDAVSWVSPIGKALLATDMGDWVTLEDGRTAKIVKIERKCDT